VCSSSDLVSIQIKSQYKVTNIWYALPFKCLRSINIIYCNFYRNLSIAENNAISQIEIKNKWYYLILLYTVIKDLNYYCIIKIPEMGLKNTDNQSKCPYLCFIQLQQLLNVFVHIRDFLELISHPILGKNCYVCIIITFEPRWISKFCSVVYVKLSPYSPFEPSINVRY